MLKLRLPIRAIVPNILNVKWSSSNVTDIKENHDAPLPNRNKIETDKFKAELPILLQKLKHPGQFKAAERQPIFVVVQKQCSDDSLSNENQEQLVSDLTNIFDISPAEPSVVSENLKVQQKHEPVFTTPSGSPNTCQSPTISREHATPLKTGNPTLMTATAELHSLKDYGDVCTPYLPLALHCKDENLIIASIVQDFNNLQCKTTEGLEHLLLFIQNSAQQLYNDIEKNVLKPSASAHTYVQGKTEDAMIAFLMSVSCAVSELQAKISDTTLKLADTSAKTGQPLQPTSAQPKSDSPKKSAGSEESPIDKIKKAIQNWLAILKKKIDEQKKKMEEQKKKPSEAKKPEESKK